MDWEKLHFILRAKATDLQSYGKLILPSNAWGGHVYKDNGSHVLAIAHVDTAIKAGWSCDTGEGGGPDGDRLIFSPALDDRLGVYIITELLPSLGIVTDILLTDGEEQGKSTGRDFKPEKKYNWMFQFDRHGDGTVMYQYEDQDMRQLVRRFGWKVEQGTMSDISTMEELGCKAFNFGVGYHDEHSTNCYASVNEMLGSVGKFKAFYHEMRGVRLPHEKKVYRWESYSGDDWSFGHHGSSRFREWRRTQTETRDTVIDGAVMEDVQCPSCERMTPFIIDSRGGNRCRFCAINLDIWYADELAPINRRLPIGGGAAG